MGNIAKGKAAERPHQDFTGVAALAAGGEAMAEFVKQDDEEEHRDPDQREIHPMIGVRLGRAENHPERNNDIEDVQANLNSECSEQRDRPA
jgi:hypothetical protein